MKKIWFLICIMPSICYPQINENGINKDYWKNKPSACVHVFNNPQFVGLLLDGKKLEQNEIHLKKIIENITEIGRAHV